MAKGNGGTNHGRVIHSLAAPVPRRAILLGLSFSALAGCGTNAEWIWAPDEAIDAARYSDPASSYLALVTVRGEANGDGVHTALLINASERVLFDPYGRWTDPFAPERNDVLYGFSPQVEERYLTYQAKGGYFFVRQEVLVPPEVAEQALVLAKGYGAVGMAECTRATSDVLQQLPGFEAIGVTWLPESLSRRFARLPGVMTIERHGPSV